LDAVFECLRERRVVILTGRGQSKKFFVRREAERLKARVVELSGEGLDRG
jgi:hypothetical protein